MLRLPINLIGQFSIIQLLIYTILRVNSLTFVLYGSKFKLFWQLFVLVVILIHLNQINGYGLGADLMILSVSWIGRPNVKQSIYLCLVRALSICQNVMINFIKILEMARLFSNDFSIILCPDVTHPPVLWIGAICAVESENNAQWACRAPRTFLSKVLILLKIFVI